MILNTAGIQILHIAWGPGFCISNNPKDVLPGMGHWLNHCTPVGGRCISEVRDGTGKGGGTCLSPLLQQEEEDSHSQTRQECVGPSQQLG